MAQYLKSSASAEAKADADRKVQEVGKMTLSDIAKLGDAAVRDFSIGFDGRDRESYLLTTQEKQDCLDQLSGQD